MDEMPDTAVTPIDAGQEPPPEGEDYWHALVDEKAAAEFLGLSPRTIQDFRQRGGGPRYIAISARCLRYRRIDLRAWADSRIRKSTADPGQKAA
jgi:predicted DNA-binding transcriptional regulator AlpA